MELLPDDPIVRSMERTGYPPWMQDDYCDPLFSEEDETFDYEEDYL